MIGQTIPLLCRAPLNGCIWQLIETDTIWMGKGCSFSWCKFHVHTTYGWGVLLAVHLVVDNRRRTLTVHKPTQGLFATHPDVTRYASNSSLPSSSSSSSMDNRSPVCLPLYLFILHTGKVPFLNHRCTNMLIIISYNNNYDSNFQGILLPIARASQIKVHMCIILLGRAEASPT